MTEEEKIRQVFYRFEDGGLVSKDIEKVMDCMADRLLGIGIGEQGIVTSRDDVRRVFLSGLKSQEPGTHRLEYGRVEVMLHTEEYATLCAQVTVISADDCGRQITSSFLQLLSLLLERGDWKICALHASAPVVTEEALEAYPLKFAEKTLQSLKEKIGEQAYQAEEQYRQAILSDTIAFYVLNLTRGICEKCQCNGELCVKLEEGDSYERCLDLRLPEYVVPEDREGFLRVFSLTNMRAAFARGEKELSYEYRLRTGPEDFIWAVTSLRMIVDRDTGECKAIMYVRNIDKSKRAEIELKNKATYDGMTRLYNQQSMIQAIRWQMEKQGFADAYFVMLDVDNFKQINDTFGHPVGDMVLIAIADVLHGLFWERAVVGRLGGDEYGLFLYPVRSQAELGELLAEMQEGIRRINIEQLRGRELTCSVGVSHCPPGMSFEHCYRQADSALYCSKNNGKNQISFFGE